MVGVVNKSGRGLQIFARASRADLKHPPLLNPGYATEACNTKVFKNTYKSRELVVWTEKLQSMVQKIIETYSFFHTFSLTDDDDG